MLAVVQTDEENFNDGFCKFVYTIVVVFIPHNDGGKRLNSSPFLDKVIWLDIFFFKEVDNFFDLIVIFFICISSDNDLKLFTGTLSLFLISIFKEYVTYQWDF